MSVFASRFVRCASRTTLEKSGLVFEQRQIISVMITPRTESLSRLRMNLTPNTSSSEQDVLLEYDQIKGKVCNRCGVELPEGFKAVCGIKNPCPRCGYLYPVGDCAD